MHSIQARKAGASPWGWRDAVVLSVDSEARLAYLEGEATLSVWHHEPLAGLVAQGEPVRVHEQYHLLAVPRGWFSVAITGGLGPVDTPVDELVWEAESTVAIVDVAQGSAIATDHEAGSS